MLQRHILLVVACTVWPTNGATPLFEAVQRQDTGAVHDLLAKGTAVDPVSMMAADAWSPQVASMLRNRWREDGKVPDEPLPAPVVFGIMQSLSPKIVARWNDEDIRMLITQIRADLQWMQGRWKAAGQKPSPAEYRASLTQTAWLFWRTLSLDKSGEARKAIAAVASDIATKAADCRAIPDGLGRMVPIEIRARKNGQDMHGWQVFVKPKLLENVATFDPRPFPKLTSPVAWELPPGVYVAIARKPQSTLRSDPVDITVGSGKKLVSWDIPVP